MGCLSDLATVVKAVSIPVKAVGGLTIAQNGELPKYGVHHLVVGAPLAVDADAFKAPAHDVEAMLREIIARLRGGGI